VRHVRLRALKKLLLGMLLDACHTREGKGLYAQLQLLSNAPHTRERLEYTLRWGYLWRIWACRRRLALPTRAPSGRSAKLEAVGEINASLTSSLGRLHGNIVPSGRYVGTSCETSTHPCEQLS